MIDLFLHLDVHLANVIAAYGPLTYGILFLIVFCETGLVVTPFLPGDSLLFAAGTFAARGDLNLALLLLLLSIAAIGGNTVNYLFGRWFGETVFTDHAKILKKDYLTRTHAFYERYGAKAIMLSRFAPIIRTVAPFVAGAGKMKWSTFLFYNTLGGLLWVFLLTCAGYFLGNIPVVRAHFEIVILAIVALSLLPPLIEWWRHRKRT